MYYFQHDYGIKSYLEKARICQKNKGVMFDWTLYGSWLVKQICILVHYVFTWTHVTLLIFLHMSRSVSLSGPRNIGDN